MGILVWCILGLVINIDGLNDVGTSDIVCSHCVNHVVMAIQGHRVFGIPCPSKILVVTDDREDLGMSVGYNGENGVRAYRIAIKAAGR